MKISIKALLIISALSTSAMSYEVANIGDANTMVCSYSHTINNSRQTTLPEFERKVSYMKVRQGGKIIIAPKGTKYAYDWVDDDGVMRYKSTNGKYKMLVYPTERGQSVTGRMHNYTRIIVGSDNTKKFASGSCRLEG